LLLGAGESGKSTVLKQLRLIHTGKISVQEANRCVTGIRKNAVESMQAVLRAMTTYGIQLENQSRMTARAAVISHAENSDFTRELAKNIASLWKDSGVQASYEKRHNYWLLDAAAYYFNEVLRIGEPNYEPTEEDIIMTRIRTTGIECTDFQEPPYNYSIVDVGGQRNERRKWIHCFENVTAIVFLVGLNGYSQCLFEDTSINRMKESLKLFKQVASNPIFRETPIFLLMNKNDLFEASILKHSLKQCFPNYNGPERSSSDALKFIEGQFQGVLDSVCPGKKMHAKVVSASIREDTKRVWVEMKAVLHAQYLSSEKSKGSSKSIPSSQVKMK